MSLGDTRIRMTGSDRRDNLEFEVKVSWSSSSLFLLLLLCGAGAPALATARAKEYQERKRHYRILQGLAARDSRDIDQAPWYIVSRLIS